MAAQDGKPEQLKALIAGLECSLESYQQVFQVSPVGIAITAPDGRFIDVNPSGLRLFGVHREEVIGRTPIELGLLGPENREQQAASAVRVHEQGSVRSEQRTIRTKSGELHDVALLIDVIELQGQRCFLSTFLDITEQKRAQKIEATLQSQLIFSDRMSSVGTLAAGVAHEINNPLAYVMSNLDLIAEEIRTLSGGSPSGRMKELEEMVNEARHGAERVRKIVRGMKTFSRADEERRVPLDVRAVLELSINMAFNEIRHRARVVKDYGDVPLVEADEARLGQVFINLLVNAAHAIPEGHVDKNEIRIVAKTDASGRAVIEVRDSGRGIPPESLSRIFDPFFTTKAVGEGTGLGLSICHNIVTALGGEIVAESEPGKGSNFRVVLPPASQEAAQPNEVPVMTQPPVGRRGQVLIVDDDPMIGTTLRRVLGNDHEVTVATDGRQALDLLLGGKLFEVILCDLMMPHMTGMELYAELSHALPDVVNRIVFITGGAFTPAARGFLDSVPNQRFEKPFAPQNLRALVRGLVR